MLDELRARFRTRFIETARERIRKSLALLGESDGASQLVTELHSLAGEASMLGLDDIADIARTGEEAAKQWQGGTTAGQVACARALRSLSKSVEAFAAQSPAAPAAATVTETASRPVGQRVLIIDDSTLASDQLAETLARVGLDTRTALDADAAVREVQQFAPMLVVSDVHMPGVDLAALCTSLRAAAATAIIIILISGRPDDVLAQIARQVGADGYVSKLRGTGYIVDQLQRAIEGSRV